MKMNSCEMIMYDCSYRLRNYTGFLNSLLPILGKWMIFITVFPLLVGLYKSLMNRDYRLFGIHLVLLVMFGTLFIVMMMLGWEIIKFKLGVSA